MAAGRPWGISFHDLTAAKLKSRSLLEFRLVSADADLPSNDGAVQSGAFTGREVESPSAV